MHHGVLSISFPAHSSNSYASEAPGTIMHFLNEMHVPSEGAGCLNTGEKLQIPVKWNNKQKDFRYLIEVLAFHPGSNDANKTGPVCC